MDMSVVCITARANEINLCDVCGARGYVGYKEGRTIGIRGKEYFHPLHSDSLAINPSQIAEHRALFPNIKIDTEGRPIFENFRQHDDYLNKCGFQKQEQRIKPKGVRIDKPEQPSSEAYPKEIK
jgi:hypothetical protein